MFTLPLHTMRVVLARPNRRVLQFIALSVWVLLAFGCASDGARQAQTTRPTWLRAENPSLIVVTVRNSQFTSVRVGSTARDYDSGVGYGPSPQARSDVDAIAKKYQLKLLDAWPIEVLNVHCVVYAAPANADMTQLLVRIQEDRRVESAQPLNTFATLAVPNAGAAEAHYTDPYFGLQSNLRVLQAPQAQRVTRGAGVRIAVIDTGMDASHPDLAGRVSVQRNFAGREKAREVRERHGTAVAGVIAALDNNGQGIVGIAPASKLLSLRACWPTSVDDSKAVCNTFTLAQALAAAIELRADIVNLSLGGPADPLLDRLVAAGVQRGIVYVGAAPNHFDSSARYFPLSAPGVIGVASVEDDAAIGASQMLRAPGANILTLIPAGGYDFMSGSSLAAASVSAGVALLMAHRRGVERAVVYSALAASPLAAGRVDSSRVDSSRVDSSGESGSVDLCAALVAIDRRAQCARE